jgi:anion-transporting  ArsA/GET3 family ATPase
VKTVSSGVYKDISAVIDSNRLIVCVGSGGVGKTTIAASIGIEAAHRGRKALVITIDPARRLANALGIDSIGNVASEVELGSFVDQGQEFEAGKLSAMMLDTRTAFDELIMRVSPDEVTRDRILHNKIYREVSSCISTSQEYMASEKLYQAYNSSEYDLIVLDTPPMKNALDFLEAP